MAAKKKRESYKSANAANKERRATVRKPDATRCGLCGAMCTDPTEVSRHHMDTCSRHPDNSVHYQTGADSCACGNLWPCTRMTGPGKTKRPKKPRPPWPRGPSVIPPPDDVAEALGASSHEPVRGDGMQQYMEGRARTQVPLADKNGMPWEHIHETKGSAHCMACIVEDNAPRVGGQAWADFTQELIGKLGFSPRYPGLTDEQHLVELVGPTWAEDVKKKWVVNWTVDGYLARRPHLKAKPRNSSGALDKYGHAEAETSWPRWINALLRLLGHDPNQDKMSLELYMQAHGINREDALDKYARDWTVEEYVSKNPQLRGRGKAHEGSSRWYVEVTKRGVSFNIDHQGFLLRDDYDPEDGLTKEQYYTWYARQLTIAFKRLTGD